MQESEVHIKNSVPQSSRIIPECYPFRLSIAFEAITNLISESESESSLLPSTFSHRRNSLWWSVLGQLREQNLKIDKSSSMSRIKNKQRLNKIYKFEKQTFFKQHGLY